jgi:hypothetical protein
MAIYYSQSEIARMAGVSPTAISKAVREGRVIRTPKGVDPEHPTNQYFLSQRNRFRTGDHEENGQPSGQPPIQKNNANKKRTTKSRTPKSKQKDNGTIVTTQDVELEHYDRPAAEMARIQAQTNKINLSIAERLGTLVPRDEVAKAFGRIYAVSVNHLLNMGDRLAPIIAGICGASDQDAKIKIKNKIDTEITRALDELKREAAKYDESASS